MKYGYILACVVFTCLVLSTECGKKQKSKGKPMDMEEFKKKKEAIERPMSKTETKAAAKDLKKVMGDIQKEVKKQANYIKNQLCKNKDIGPLAIKQIAGDLEDETCNKNIKMLKDSVRKEADGIRKSLCKEKTFGSKMLKEIADDLSKATCKNE